MARSLLLNPSLDGSIMDKQTILAIMARNDSHCRSDPFTIAAALAEKLEEIEGRLTDQDLCFLIRLGAAVYQSGIDEYGEPEPSEDFFPARDSFTWDGQSLPGQGKRQ